MLISRKNAGLTVLAVLALSYHRAKADDVLLVAEDVPAHGLVACPVDLTEAARFCRLGPVVPENIRAERVSDGAPVAVQFVPADGFDAEKHVVGTMLMKLPGGGSARVRLSMDAGQSSPEEPFDGTVATGSYRAVHDAAKMGGLPCRFEFAASGKVFEQFRWNDRLYDRQLGGFNLANDPRPRVERISTGPLATVVRVVARYMQADGKQPDSKAKAVYQWCYWNDLPLVRVTATATQQPPQPWSEAHFLELNFPGDDFPTWAGGEPTGRGPFTGETKSFHFDRWGALVDGNDALAMLDCGRAMFYDHRGGSYLHAHGDRAWQAWSEPQQQWSAWLWIGTTDDVAETIRTAAGALPSMAHVEVTTVSVHARIEMARRQWQAMRGTARQQAWWQAAGAARLAAEGHFEEAIQTAEGRQPAHWTVLSAGDLGLILAGGREGISVLSLFDTVAGRQLLSPAGVPLFKLTLRHAGTQEEARLTADVGWGGVHVESLDDGVGVEMRWSKPLDKRFGPLEVVARAVPDTTTSAIVWRLSVTSGDNDWALWRVVFPNVAVDELEPDSRLFVPRAAGQVEKNAWHRGFRFAGRYPSGWTSMQYMAAYAVDGSTGLYVAAADPMGGTKELAAESQPERNRVVLSFDHPVPDMGKPGNRFQLSGDARWQLFRGDWFDAAVIYRRWVRENAKWYPDLTAEGRADTPRWMRELAVWGLGGGDPKTGLPMLREFAREMGLPVGFHWYNWHQIPFDNDYPHYFPADEGFTEAVKLLQEKDIHVMPYINGRLWDTHDRGAEDFQFSERAMPSATKTEAGEPYIETYGSQETDGKKVELAAMCPSTDLWRDTVRRIVSRLVNECGVHGVYIDQVAAAKPQLCFDPDHGHPAGGGHWWTESYWKLLEAVRREMPDDRILTTECNAEPYIKWFDGYLTWHWQYDGQVPAFPAVYGGSIAMFGRAYRGGPTKDLALRMKAGQQLVYGEQIGWIDPGVVREKENFAFLRRIVHLRWRLRRYFYAGQMARPPKLHGHIPTVTADWQWSGVWPVTTPAAYSGAWQIPGQHKTVLLMVNVGDQPIATRLKFDTAEYGLPGETVRVVTIDSQGEGETFTARRNFQRDLTLPPRSAVAWELTPPVRTVETSPRGL